MCDYTKDIKFIEKRLDEQHNYLADIGKRWFTNEISNERWIELHKSALPQYMYFYNLKSNYESENKLPTVLE